MSFKHLAEAVILQSIEDLWNPCYRKESKVFLYGEGFRMYADIAELLSSQNNNNNITHLAGGNKHGRTISGYGDQGK